MDGWMDGFMDLRMLITFRDFSTYTYIYIYVYIYIYSDGIEREG